MNDYAFRHKERLHFAARKLARDIHALRSDRTLPKLYMKLYRTLETRLSAVTHARQVFGRWLRNHPEAKRQEVTSILCELHIPVTRPALRRAIRRIRQQVKSENGIG